VSVYYTDVMSVTRNSTEKATNRSRRHLPDEAQQLIRQSAVLFLWEHPFRDLTVAELMAGTELSRPAFYQSFGDLHGLIESLLGEVEVVMRQTANPWISGKGEPISALRVSLGGVVQTCVEHGPIIRAVAEAAPLDERLEQAWLGFKGRWDKAVRARIEAQQRDGLIARSLDAQRTANALNALDATVLISEFGRHPQGDPDAVLATLHGIWVGALYGRTPKRLRASKPSGTKRNK
jgi:AcrR family transcriptional regulator